MSWLWYHHNLRGPAFYFCGHHLVSKSLATTLSFNHHRLDAQLSVVHMREILHTNRYRHSVINDRKPLLHTFLSSNPPRYDSSHVKLDLLRISHLNMASHRTFRKATASSIEICVTDSLELPHARERRRMNIEVYAWFQEIGCGLLLLTCIVRQQYRPLDTGAGRSAIGYSVAAAEHSPWCLSTNPDEAKRKTKILHLLNYRFS
ncbi:hypothetical protein F4604DRAFT_717486 [Suillus subluteus]|nr:hypothetical protein F4604DRAFT_717486 [Suillus subluteus]